MIPSMNYMGQLWAQLLADGGIIIPFLLAIVVLIWWGLGSRFYVLFTTEASASVIWNRRKSPKSTMMDRFLSDVERKQGELNWTAALVEYEQQFQVNKNLVTTGVAIAPLLGLLGTVGGMIETFKGIGGSELFSQSGGVAGGIAQALLTTQMGLVVAVPGILLARILDKRADKLQQTMLVLIDKVRTCAE